MSNESSTGKNRPWGDESGNVLTIDRKAVQNPPRYTQAGAALHALLGEAERLVAAAAASGGMAAGRLAVLGALASGAADTSAAIARQRGAARQGVQRIVRELEAAGWVEAAADPADGRVRTLRLTESGRRAWREAAHAQAEALNARARDVSPQALRAAAHLLRALRRPPVPATGSGPPAFRPAASGPPGRPTPPARRPG